MRKTVFALLSALLAIGFASAQKTVIPTESYTVLSVTSFSGTDSVKNAFDGDTATWWSIQTAAYQPLPVTLVIDLGKEYNVCGLYYLCNIQNSSDKLLEYAVYVSNDTAQWGEAQTETGIYWKGDADVSGKELLFGAIPGRFVKIVYLDNANDWNSAIQTSELRIFSDASVTEIKRNQNMEPGSVPLIASVYDTTELDCRASSGLEVTYEVLSGPASVISTGTGYALVYDGEEGRVEAKALQAGNQEYYPVEYLFGIDLEDPNLYDVSIVTPLIEEEPIVMSSDTMYYVLEARAEVGSSFNEISELEFSVDGQVLEADFYPEYGYARARFSPGRYGDFTVNIRAAASNGKTASVSRNITVDSARESRTVRTFDSLIINYPDPGRENGGVYRFPQHVGSYQRIIAKMDVRCPNLPGGCDDWDRVAWIEIQTPDGQWRELIRYTTAYGVPCDHELDVTDFASYLQGEVPMRMFVDTWGTGGYEVYLDFEFVKGLPQYLYSSITPLWSGNFPFGDMADLQPLDTLDVVIGEDVAALNLKVVTTGHGWDKNNTSNAAEFYHAIHHLYVNESAYEQDLWMQCLPNPDECLNQRGTWYYNRAGWCPGAIAPGFNFNVTEHCNTPHLQLKYIFEEGYVDSCHSSNPKCVSGVTCSNCYDTYNPQYYIASYLISYYNKMYDSLPNVHSEQITQREELQFNTYPNPASERFFVQVFGETGPGYIQLISMEGAVIHQYTFRNAAQLTGFEINVSNIPTGIYVVRIQTTNANGIRKVVVR